MNVPLGGLMPGYELAVMLSSQVYGFKGQYDSSKCEFNLSGALTVIGLLTMYAIVPKHVKIH